jgi:ribosome recycling factor
MLSSCRKMVQSLEHLFHELAGLRTGRASPTLLDGILVDVNGDKINLPHLATVVMKGIRSLAVTVYDRDTTQAVAAAIRVSPLELQVREEGGQLIVPIPECALRDTGVWCPADAPAASL